MLHCSKLNKIVVEECIDNLVEVNASVLGNYEYQRVSVLEEVMGADEITDSRIIFDTKFSLIHLKYWGFR